MLQRNKCVQKPPLSWQKSHFYQCLMYLIVIFLVWRHFWLSCSSVLQDCLIHSYIFEYTKMPLIFCRNQLMGSTKMCKYAFDKGRNQLRGLAMALLMRLEHFHDNCELEMLDSETKQLYSFFNPSRINTWGLGIHAIALIWHYRFVSPTLLQMLTQLHPLLKFLWLNKNRQNVSIYKHLKGIEL